MSNFLIAFAHLLYDSLNQEPPVTVLLPEMYERLVSSENFDVITATQGWACLDPFTPLPSIDNVTSDGIKQVSKLPKHEYYDAPNNRIVPGMHPSVHLGFECQFMSQLLLRPKPVLRALIEAFELSLFSNESPPTRSPAANLPKAIGR